MGIVSWTLFPFWRTPRLCRLRRVFDISFLVLVLVSGRCLFLLQIRRCGTVGIIVYWRFFPVVLGAAWALAFRPLVRVASGTSLLTYRGFALALSTGSATSSIFIILLELCSSLSLRSASLLLTTLALPYSLCNFLLRRAKSANCCLCLASIALSSATIASVLISSTSGSANCCYG